MIGRTISHYRIDAELGKGGMGVVYRAHDARLRRNVALKILSGEMTDQRAQKNRIMAEARAASALNHPGITTVYEVGEAGDQLFIVMELVAGSTLRQEISKGRMDPPALLRIVGQITEALEAAHSHGVVHGDIKPENIIVQPDGRVKLLDFGIARDTSAETMTLTQVDSPSSCTPSPGITGTLAYMAPEQLCGEPAEARSDLYALGVVLYEMGAGYRPFPGPTATALMAQVLNDPPPPLGAVLPASAGQLARIVHKLLEKKPAARYQSARELKTDCANLARDFERGFTEPVGVEGKRSVAVLPFKLLTPNPEDDFLSIALADAVINQLSSSGELLVRPTSTVMRYKSQPTDPLVAARELNVHVIVDGSIQKIGPKLRVLVTAWNAMDGTTIGSCKHDSEITDLFGLQDKMAADLSMALGSKRVAESTKAQEKPTENPVAYELYLRANERLSRQNKWDIRTAIEMLESATKLDPRFTDAWARLAGACVIMAGNWEPGSSRILQAEKAAKRALALDRANANAHWARGRILWTPAKKFQNRPALRALGDALRLSPGHQDALVWKCLILLHVGLLEEAREGLNAAMVANPDNVFALTFLGQAAVYMGRPEEAGEFFTRALSIDPASLWTTLFSPTVHLYSKSWALVEEKIRLARSAGQDDPILSSYEALLWAYRGEKRKTEQFIQRSLVGKSLFHTHHTWHHTAGAYAAIGKPKEAIALLRRAAHFGLPNYPAFRDDLFFNSLHNQPQFLRLMADLKREWMTYRREFGSK
jgi:serine/threonine protein kinase/tetratricopeptide (TPR) repeat protein